MGICAYCDQHAKLTREHVWSDSILEIFQAVAPKTFDHGRQVVHEGDPMLKDTCGPCNAGMSDADDFVRRLIAQHFATKPPVGVQLPLADTRLWRWALKTAFNLHRFDRHPLDWALPLRPFMRGKTPRPEGVDLYFSAWDDLSPGGVALNLNIVHWLDARCPAFNLLDSVSEDQVTADVAMAVALKPGFAVLLPIIWKNPQSLVRRTLHAELLSNGWLDCSTDGVPQCVPFDMFTSGKFEILTLSKKYRDFIDGRIAALGDEMRRWSRDGGSRQA